MKFVLAAWAGCVVAILLVWLGYLFDGWLKRRREK